MPITVKNYLEDRITWNAGVDPEYPYESVYEGRTLKLRINDFPNDCLYTLLIDDEESLSFDDWPENWLHSDVVRIRPELTPIKRNVLGFPDFLSGRAAEDSESHTSIPTGFVLPLDVKTEQMTLHLIPEHRLMSIKSGIDTTAASLFSSTLAVCLTVAGLLLSAWIARTNLGRLATPLWGLFFASGALSIYFWKIYRKMERQLRDAFEGLRENITISIAISDADRESLDRRSHASTRPGSRESTVSLAVDRN
jgi:hypothetical protein